jgi:Rieske Fe-S protein
LLKLNNGGRERALISYDDVLFIKKMLHIMRNPKTKFDTREFVKRGESYLFSYANRNNISIDEKRRKFLKSLIFGISAAAVASLIPGLELFVPPNIAQTSSFPKSILVNSSGNPIKASSIPVNSPIITIFEYPLSGEPNFLINLGDENDRPVKVPQSEVVVPQSGKSYIFPGGVGPYNSIVAYSAICQHLGCQPPIFHFYPPNHVNPSQITSPPPSQLSAEAYLAAKKAGIPAVIHCDCHGSTYDPYHGASVLTGPTVRPLPAIILEWDSDTDYIYAIGVIGVATYPQGGDGIPTKDPSIDLASSFGNSVGNKTVVSETGNPF